MVETRAAEQLLTAYYSDYAAIAAQAGASLLLESPTWRANPDWATRLGYYAAALDRANRASVDLCASSRRGARTCRVSSQRAVGPRGDGYRARAAIDPAEAADYHRPQLASFPGPAPTGRRRYTMTDVGEAIGISRRRADSASRWRSRSPSRPTAASPEARRSPEAIAAVDADCPPAYFLVNCAHPTHVARGLEPGPWTERVHGLRVNASTMSHAELDESEVLDDGDPVQLAKDNDSLRQSLTSLSIVGGCCGTDARHVAAMWGVGAW